VAHCSCFYDTKQFFFHREHGEGVDSNREGGSKHIQEILKEEIACREGGMLFKRPEGEIEKNTKGESDSKTIFHFSLFI
jgi:hypothetical protein